MARRSPPLDLPDVKHALAACRAQLASGALTDRATPYVRRIRALTIIATHLHDLLDSADALGFRVGLSDEVEDHIRPRDVTELVRRLRHTLMHEGDDADSPRRVLSVGFGGTSGDSGLVGGRALRPEYFDDVAHEFGQTRVLVRRHLMAALDEVTHRFTTHFEEDLCQIGSANGLDRFWRQSRHERHMVHARAVG